MEERRVGEVAGDEGTMGKEIWRRSHTDQTKGKRKGKKRRWSGIGRERGGEKILGCL